MKPDFAAGELSEIRTVSYCATVELAHERINTLKVGWFRWSMTCSFWAYGRFD